MRIEFGIDAVVETAEEEAKLKRLKALAQEYQEKVQELMQIQEEMKKITIRFRPVAKTNYISSKAERSISSKEQKEVEEFMRKVKKARGSQKNHLPRLERKINISAEKIEITGVRYR